MRVVTNYPPQTTFFPGYSTQKAGTLPFGQGNPSFTRFAGEQNSTDSFTKLSTAIVPTSPATSSVSLPVQPLAPVNPFSLTVSGTSAENLASRMNTFMNDPSMATANTKALFDAAAGKLTTDPAGLSSSEREAQSLVQTARQLDVNSKLKLVSQLSGGSDTLASQLAAQSLQQHTPIGMGDLVSAWRSQPNTESNRGISDALSVLGTSLLALQIVAPAGMVSPSLMNGFLNTAAIVAL